jgi:hypothetical protein
MGIARWDHSQKLGEDINPTWIGGLRAQRLRIGVHRLES